MKETQQWMHSSLRNLFSNTYYLCVVILPAIAQSRWRLPRSPTGSYSLKFSFCMFSCHRCSWRSSWIVQFILVMIISISLRQSYYILFPLYFYEQLYLFACYCNWLHLFLLELLYLFPPFAVVSVPKDFPLLLFLIHIIRDPVHIWPKNSFLTSGAANNRYWSRRGGLQAHRRLRRRRKKTSSQNRWAERRECEYQGIAWQSDGEL